jgi:hypothetical protein
MRSTPLRAAYGGGGRETIDGGEELGYVNAAAAVGGKR